MNKRASSGHEQLDGGRTCTGTSVGSWCDYLHQASHGFCEAASASLHREGFWARGREAHQPHVSVRGTRGWYKGPDPVGSQRRLIGGQDRRRQPHGGTADGLSLRRQVGEKGHSPASMTAEAQEWERSRRGALGAYILGLSEADGGRGPGSAEKGLSSLSPLFPPLQPRWPRDIVPCIRDSGPLHLLLLCLESSLESHTAHASVSSGLC